MRKTFIAVPLALSALALAACGADGEPVTPELEPRNTGPGVSVSVTGKAEMGISG